MLIFVDLLLSVVYFDQLLGAVRTQKLVETVINKKSIKILNEYIISNINEINV